MYISSSSNNTKILALTNVSELPGSQSDKGMIKFWGHVTFISHYKKHMNSCGETKSLLILTLKIYQAVLCKGKISQHKINVCQMLCTKHTVKKKSTLCCYVIFLLNHGFLLFEGQYRFLSEKAMAPHSSTLAWKIPWTEEPGRLHSMGSQRVRHDWATSLSLFTFLHWRRKWQPTPLFLPGESQGLGHTRVGHDWSDLA